MWSLLHRVNNRVGRKMKLETGMYVIKRWLKTRVGHLSLSHNTLLCFSFVFPSLARAVLSSNPNEQTFLSRSIIVLESVTEYG